MMLSVFAVASFVAATSVADVPDPRPLHHVVDLTGTLGADDIANIDDSAARAAPYGELMVVVVRSLDGEPSRSWATSLFNRMALDTRGRNHGVIYVAALGDHKAEIVFGDGYASSTSSITDKIMQDVVVWNFKGERPRAALVDGARAILERVFWNRSAPPGMLVTLDHNRVPAGIGGGVFGFGMLFGLARTVKRRRPRTCPECKTLMTRLDEAGDDAHLAKHELTEERVKSVDYDVWLCRGCGNVTKLRYAALFTLYKNCDSCKARTLRSTSRTISSATTTSTGLVEVTDNCSHCGKSSSYTYSTPMITESSSSSSSSSYDSGGGGGFSSGGGSSGSW